MNFNLHTYPLGLLLHFNTTAGRRVTVQQNHLHRWLEIDGVIQSVMSRSHPSELCLPHQQQIATLLPTEASHILGLGLGGGDFVRYFQRCWPASKQEWVELDSDVLTLYSLFFQPANTAVTTPPILHHADALTFMEQSSTHYDLIFLDIFSQDGNPAMLFQVPLYRAIARCLTGALIVNLLPRTELEQRCAIALLEQWIGPTTVYTIPGVINQILYATQEK